jgi:hypothetical protein
MKVNDWHYEGYMGGRIDCDIAPINTERKTECSGTVIISFYVFLLSDTIGGTSGAGIA